MIIKSITLENFRQFRGEQSIDFSTNSNKKATLIIAKNGTGKTTLLESFAWIFYGDCALKTIMNSKIKSEMKPYDEVPIRGEVKLVHLNVEYTITRRATMRKQAARVSLDESYFNISHVEKDGTFKELRGTDAKKFMLEIVPKELFGYFFFKGESIERIGKEIADGKNSKNNEFVKAIKSMLGFDYLYETIKDLKVLLDNYEYELEKNNTDEKSRAIEAKINATKRSIEETQDRLKQAENAVSVLTNEKNNISNELLKSGDVSQKQRDAIRLAAEIKNCENSINASKKALFSKFSSVGYKIIAKETIELSIKLLEENGDIDKGIPGLDSNAVKHLLKMHKCICGCDLKEGDDHYNALVDLIKYLPPNNLGSEIRHYKEFASLIIDQGNDYYNDFVDLRKKIETEQSNYEQKNVALKRINDEIKNFPDMTKLKEREIELEEKIKNQNEQIGALKLTIESLLSTLDSAIKEKSNYEVIDSHVRRLQECEYQVERLIFKIEEYVNRRESEKRAELEEAINDIFVKIFDIDIKVELTSDFGIKLKSGKNTTLEDFEAGGAQSAILAFSFIGGIIKLARNRASLTKEKNKEALESVVEPYPLVMDAPSSTFDIDRIECFCQIMPSIAEQVIFFIKDTDGFYVKRNLKNILGKEYAMNQVSNSQTVIDEIKEEE